MIRKREENDVDTIINIWFESQNLAHPFLEKSFVEKVRKDLREIYLPNTDTWVYEEEGKIVGFISMIENEIGGLFVKPDHHSKGIGSKLVDLVRMDHENLEVEVFEKNRIGRSFYLKYGFTEIKTYYHKESNQMMLRLQLKA